MSTEQQNNEVEQDKLEWKTVRATVRNADVFRSAEHCVGALFLQAKNAVEGGPASNMSLLERYG